MSKIAIFASGKGSNADHLISYFKNGTSVTVEMIVTTNPKAAVQNVARNHGVNFSLITMEELNGNLLVERLNEQGIELLVLAGFLKKIPASLITAFPNRIINIHPSLLPKYGGKGMYGMHVHEAVLNGEEKESGITIHLVNSEYDKGEVLAQFKCPVDANDTVESLRQKVQKLEHSHFPMVIENYIQSKLRR